MIYYFDINNVLPSAIAITTRHNLLSVRPFFSIRRKACKQEANSTHFETHSYVHDRLSKEHRSQLEPGDGGNHELRAQLSCCAKGECISFQVEVMQSVGKCIWERGFVVEKRASRGATGAG